MAITLYQSSVPVFLHMLKAMRGCLTKAMAQAETLKFDPAVLASARLYPNMFPLTRQIQIVSTLEPVSAFLSDWRGSIFVKGSRRYQLEKVLEVQTSFPLPC